MQHAAFTRGLRPPGPMGHWARWCLGSLRERCEVASSRVIENFLGLIGEEQGIDSCGIGDFSIRYACVLVSVRCWPLSCAYSAIQEIEAEFLRWLNINFLVAINQKLLKPIEMLSDQTLHSSHPIIEVV
ncbi:uncharacterized protein LOC131162308 [Malania oleifera]|uniref:uncharacterized protein LOC131162308 n=1 Tax=Malania oleifera TaxID=397392 RepID=UPI0025AE488D|nr:uncharacterized protein LOC131162308 [Malania oleifera]